MAIDARHIRQRSLPETHSLPADLPAALQRVLSARGLERTEQLSLTLNRLARPDGLGGLDTAAGLLADLICDDGRLLIIGDFDADGATATALALRALRAMGLRQADYRVPNRFTQGYGLSPGLVDSLDGPNPDLLMTVDNGISSISGVEAAKARGWSVIVTDHHLPGETLPTADAIINPCLPDSQFPSRNLAGVGVVFYLLSAVRATLQHRGWFHGRHPAPNLAQWLDLVALGTVADLVRLDDNNRILVKAGLDRIRSGRCSAGILALIDVSGRAPGFLTASDLGFALAPRLNAAGRLEDMGRGIDCLLSDDPNQARMLAEELDGLNQQRRALQDDMQDDALASLNHLSDDLQKQKNLPAALCLYQPHWHQGVVGLVASRIKERLHRPVFAFAREQEGSEQLKGSGRSIPGVHLRDLLAAVDALHPGLIERFGGHAMAAGLTLPARHLETFERCLSETAQKQLSPEVLQRVIWTDGPLRAGELDLEMAKSLESISPWGQGFPEPLFDNEFQVLDRQLLKHKHLKLWLDHAGQQIEAIAFDVADRARALEGYHRMRLLYHPQINRFRGRERLQLRVSYLLPPSAKE